MTTSPSPFAPAAVFQMMAIGLLTACAIITGCTSPGIQSNATIDASAPPKALPPGMVHQSGQHVVDGASAPLVLRGVDLGGWLIWEGWIFGGGVSSASQSDMMSRLSSVIGANDAAAFEDQVHQTFITETDFAFLAKLGFNCVRLPINYRILEDPNHPYVYKQDGWDLIDRVVNWGEKYGVYVVIDLHAAPGGQAPFFPFDPEAVLLWNSEDEKARTVALWQAIAQRYQGRSGVAGYDLLGEPLPPSGQDLVTMYQRIIAAIRQVDPHHLIILEGGNFARDFSMFTSPLDGNMAYSFHMYTWFGDDRQTALNSYKALSVSQNVPLWCGESGENTYDMVRSTVDLFEDPSNGVLGGWTFWTWKKTSRNNGFPFLIGYTCSPAWGQVIDWLSFPTINPQPSAAVIRQGMSEFLTAVQFANTQTDWTMVEALLAPRPSKAGG